MSNAFIQAFIIIVREGLEAMLVIAALAAYLTKSGAGERVRSLHFGALAAVGASCIAAWIFATFFAGGHNDKMETAVLFAAALLMLYVSGWLMIRQDPRGWRQYLARKANAAMTQQSVWAIGGLAFLAVFREGAETVLFLTALATSAGGWTVALFGGIAAGGVLLIVAYKFINVIALKLPLRPVFVITSCFLFVIAIKFIGAAVQELQEMQAVATTPVAGGGWLQTLGLNASVEALAAQAVVIILALATYAIAKRRALKEETVALQPGE
jgi:high-affinity iron transporter